MRIALASARAAPTVDAALATVRRQIADAADHGARVVGFPEAYVPGLRGLDFEVPPFDETTQERVVREVAAWAREHQIAVVLGMEWLVEGQRHIAAAVFGADGTLDGVQTKTQLDPTEESLYAAGHGREVFETDGLRFGAAICHEGFRYPETVRWAARRGAHVVFHPHCTGSDHSGSTPTTWGAPDAPYYEKAVMCRALENTIYVASVNYAFRYPESATCVVDPSGACVARLPYGEEGVLVVDLDPGAATGLLAARYAPDRYVDAPGPSAGQPPPWR